jgi:DNA mismatch endonuclease (patch repair protein)
MADKFDKETRSKIMAKVTGRNTKPEIAVRKLLWKMGFRYRLHDKNLPGKPDIVFSKKKKAIFVHGCFWHNHTGCKRATMPQSNADYWQEKIWRNVRRDRTNIAELESMRWQVLIVWECELKNVETLKSKLLCFLR